jgi:hypothetical protein
MFTGKWLLDILSEVAFAGTEFGVCAGQYVSPTCPDHLCTLMEKIMLLLFKRNIYMPCIIDFKENRNKRHNTPKN